MLIPLKKASSEAWRTREKNGIFYPLCRRKVIERSVKKQRRKKKLLTFFFFSDRHFRHPLLNNAVVEKLYIYIHTYMFFLPFRGYFIPQSSIVFWIIEGETIKRESFFFFPSSFSGGTFFFLSFFFIPLLSKSPSPLKWFFILYFYYWSPNGCHTQRGKKIASDLLLLLFTFLTLRRGLWYVFIVR